MVESLKSRPQVKSFGSTSVPGEIQTPWQHPVSGPRVRLLQTSAPRMRATLHLRAPKGRHRGMVLLRAVEVLRGHHQLVRHRTIRMRLQSPAAASHPGRCSAPRGSRSTSLRLRARTLRRWRRSRLSSWLPSSLSKLRKPKLFRQTRSKFFDAQLEVALGRELLPGREEARIAICKQSRAQCLTKHGDFG